MYRILLAVIAVTTLLTPAICSATPPRPGPYISIFAGVSGPVDSDAKTDSPIGLTFSDRVEFDTGIYAGGAAGFDLGYLRVEGELSYRYSEIKSVTETSPNPISFNDVDGNLGVLAFMANVFFDLHNNSQITPYFGGGIGVAVLYLEHTTAFDAGNPVVLYPRDDDAVFAYQAGAGVEIAINPILSVDVGYRYFGTEKGSFQSGPTGRVRMGMESHNGMVGLRMKF